ncbi:MAG: RHS repeat-associated core domain-containing protein [Bacteroides sp.]|nr:RHS repeat-associated core domain-containing protein [Bacteroides sp.]
MKRYYILLAWLILTGTGQAYAQTPKKSYILKRTYLHQSNSPYLDQIDYFDGFGRPEQSIQKGITPDKKDLVTLQEYDSYGRESDTWLPAAIPGNNGAYVATQTIKNLAKTTNTNEGQADSHPYTRIKYEDSPLNRVLERTGPGAQWHNNGKSVKTTYTTNSGTTGDLACKHFWVYNESTGCRIWKTNFYADGELFVTQITDEDGNRVYEFRNKVNQLVLTRQFNTDGRYDTYYIYDDYGNLCYVLPPRVIEETTDFSNGNAIMQKLAYMYHYDNGRRCIAKKLPGVDWIYYIYDHADRLIFTQDGEARAKGQWLFSIPDTYGRVALTGTCGNVLNYLSEPLNNKIVKATWAGNSGAHQGYNLSGISLTGTVNVLTANYYDNYNFLSLSGCPALAYETPSSDYGKRYDGKYQGLLTGTFVKGADDNTLKLYTALYYDERGRLVQSHQNNHLGGKDSEFTGYNFSGLPLKQMIKHTASGNTTIEYYEQSYDHVGRPRVSSHKLGHAGASTAYLTDILYDDLGRKIATLDGPDIGTIYSYNVRSWLKNIDNYYFTQTLYYNDTYAGSTARYNGNISAMNWKVGNESLRGYRFNYDNLSRLTRADYLVNGTLNNNYKVPVINYDKHGNITALERWGKTATGYGLVDKLTMAYNGNQLTSVTDAGVKNPAINLGLNDFKDGSNAAVQYIYNRNGALTKDLNKGISEIKYNSLNLPSKLTINSIQNKYTYLADGTKLKVTHGSDSTEYVGNKIYENGSLKRILFANGYIDMPSKMYHYYVRDHLGNNRLVMNNNLEVIQKNHYYPFGMTFGEISSTEQDKQPYKYNGKELDRKNGLNLYDYSARYMEPALGRFTTMDPHAENYYSISPYAYCANNPISRIDPTGKDWWSTSDPDEIWKFWMAYTRNPDLGTRNGYDYGNWENRYTDEEVLSMMGNLSGNLSYNDQTRNFYTSFSFVENNEVVVVGVSISAKMVFTHKDGEGGYAVITPLANGGLTNIYPEFDIFFAGTNIGRHLIKEFVRSLLRSNSTTNTFDANSSGFSKVARGNQKDDGLSNLDDYEIANALKGLKGKLSKEQKAYKQRLKKEEKSREKRNIQKKNSEKGVGTGRRR